MLIIGMDGFSPVDDHTFVNSVLQGKHYLTYIIPELGRFMPATSQEYDLASRVFRPTPELFHAIGALKVVICCVLILAAIASTGIGNGIAAALWTAVIFSIGFANSAFRLHVGELNALALTLLFIMTVVFAEKREPIRAPRDAMISAVGIAAIVAAFFYKESIFILSLTFGCAELVRHLMRRSPVPWRISATLLVSLLYIIGYVIWYKLNVTSSYASFHVADRTTTAFSYAQNDPLIIFVLLPVTAWRAIRIVANGERQTLYDSMLVAACNYLLAYLVLGIFNTYYLLPAYGFAAIGIAGTLAKRLEGTPRGVFFAIYLWCLGLNFAPMAVSDMLALRSISNNHLVFIRYLANWLWLNESNSSGPRKLVMAGVTPGNGVEILVSLGKFLQFHGVKDSMFEIKAEGKSDNEAISSFYKLDSQGGYTPQVNDLVIHNPYPEFGTSLPLRAPSYDTVFRSTTEWTFPRRMIIDWVRQCAFAEYTCETVMRPYRRYTGYAASRLIRPAMSVETVALKRPSFEIGPLEWPERMPTRDERTIDVLVRNTGDEIWPVQGDSPSEAVVRLAYVWLDEKGAVALEGGRSTFPEPMRPGDVAEVPITVRSPADPGRYRLVVSPVQETVSWFYSSRAGEADTGMSVDVYRR